MFNTKIPIDTITSTKNNLILGGYDLKDSLRSGSIFFYNKLDMNFIDKIDTSGTLDIKIHKENIYAANSTDIMAISLENKSVSKANTTSMNTFITFFDDKLAVSSIDGTVGLYTNEMSEIKRLSFFDDPIWVSEICDNILITGSEAGELKFVDINIEKKIGNMKRESGITSIYKKDNLYYIGSYDEYIDVVEIRNFKTINRIKIGGGVWRIKYWNDKFFIACVYEGVKVFDNLFNLEHQYKTNSIAYGMEICDNFLYYTSFYDCMLYKEKLTEN